MSEVCFNRRGRAQSTQVELNTSITVTAQLSRTSFSVSTSSLPVVHCLGITSASCTHTPKQQHPSCGSVLFLSHHPPHRVGSAVNTPSPRNSFVIIH